MFTHVIHDPTDTEIVNAVVYYYCAYEHSSVLP